MKRYYLIIAMIALFNTGVFAQGVDFRQISLRQALEQGRAENKPVFLDCYATNCAVCKYMLNTVFAKKEARDYFNKRFICIKLNMDEGEGPELAKKYGTKAYPVFFILNPDGTPMYSLKGGCTLIEFIARLESLENHKKDFAGFEKEFANGTIAKENLLDYWLMSCAQGTAGSAKSREAGSKLYGTLTEQEKTEKKYWPLLMSQVTGPVCETMDFMLNNREVISKNAGKENTDTFIALTFDRYLKRLISDCEWGKPDYTEIPDVIGRLQKTYIPRQKYLLAIANIIEACASGNVETYLAALENDSFTLDDYTKLSVVRVGAILIRNKAGKGYYTRLAGIAGKLADSMEKEQDKTKAISLAKKYKTLE